MKSHLFVFCFALMFACAAFSAETEQEVMLFETFEESVVMIYQGLYFDSDSVSKPSIFNKIEEKYGITILDKFVTLSTGSGFIISKSGHVITNHHVIEADDLAEIRKYFYENTIKEFFSKIPRSLVSSSEYDSLRKDFKNLVDKSKFYHCVVVNNKDNYVLQLLDSDKDLDVALLKTLDSPDNFKSILIGDSDELKVGQSVIAIGYPVPGAFGAFKDFKSSLTTGSVSAIRSDAWGIQHTASISPGNSGGPLFNKKGELVGVNVGAITTGNNLFFSIPSNKLKTWLGSTKYKEVVELNSKEAFRLGTQYGLKDGFLEIGTSILIKVADGYEVSLDGKNRGYTPLLLEDLAPGEHTLVIQSEKEYKEEKLKVIAFKTETFVYQPVLEKYSGKLFVQTKPAGADIMIKGKKYGVTPNIVEKLAIGGYDVRVVMDGYFPETIELTIEKNKTYRVERELKKAFLVSIKPGLPVGSKVVASTAGKTINFDDKQKIELYKGEWEIIISGERFETKTFHVTIADASVSIDFTPVANYATLVFNNLKKESAVIIDDQDKTGSIKNNKIELASGKHTVRVKTKDMNDFEQSVDLVPESSTAIEVTYAYSKEYNITRIAERIDRAEAALKATGATGMSSTLELETIEQELNGYKEKSQQLLERVNKLMIESIKQDEAALMKRIKEAEDGKGVREIIKWGSLGVCVAGAGLAVTGQILGSPSYEKYQSATITSEAIKYKQEVRFWDMMTWISGGAASAGAGVSLYFWFTGPDSAKMKGDLDALRVKREGRETK